MNQGQPNPGGATPRVSDAAVVAYDADLCTVPAAADGTKRPGLNEWKRYQTERPSIEQVLAWFDGTPQGFGVICGRVSGGLEMLEFEGRARCIYTEFVRASRAAGLGDLIDRIRDGYEEETPTGGIHWLYRSEQITGNLKLARRPGPAEHDVEVLIETRGEGGFVIVAPSGGTVHPNGGSWVLSAGGFESIATITPDERAELHRVAALFDEMPPRDPPRSPSSSPRTDGDRPGDRYNATTTWAEVLEPHGYTDVYEHDGETAWRRPGKDHGISATTNYRGSDLLYVFSTSTPFESERGYDRFGAYAVLNHGGHLRAAARALARDRDDGLRGDGREKDLGDDDEQQWSASLEEGVPPGNESPPHEGNSGRRRQGGLVFRPLRAWRQDYTAPQWLIRGFLIDHAFDVFGGAEKSLKSWLMHHVAIALAARVPLFALDEFHVSQRGTTLLLTGEGGVDLVLDRIAHLCEGMYGTDIDEVLDRIIVTADIAPMSSRHFAADLTAAIAEHQPVLVQLDPLYVYFGEDHEAGNVFSTGPALVRLRDLTAGRALQVAHHFTKIAADRLTLASLT
jgi:AAA domain/Bifunctional DNA primase/polymerase, N-terminal